MSAAQTDVWRPFQEVYADLIRHAEKFGTDCVLVTAEQRHHRESDLPTLKVILHKIGSKRRPRWASDNSPAPTGDDVGIAVDRLVGDKLSHEEIASVLGVNLATVRGHLKPWVKGESPRVERLRREILTLRESGLMPAAIADALKVGDATVQKYLRREPLVAR